MRNKKSIMKEKSIGRAALSCVFTVMPLCEAVAQDIAKSQSYSIEEVVVTAQKREQSMQEVPISVSAFNEKDLDREGIQNFQDIESSVPNLSMSTTSAVASRVNMRGIPSHPNGAFNSGTSPGLGMYVDGVVYSRPSGFNQELSNIERVEVLRGPQGTLFGQNTNLGVISITTRKPSDVVEGKIKADFGNYDLQRLNGYVSAPIVEDQVAASIGGFTVKRDGYIDNVDQGGTIDSEDRYGGRAQLRLTPNDQLTVDVSAELLKDSGDPTSVSLTEVGLGLFAAGVGNNPVLINDAIRTDDREASVNEESHYLTRDNWGLDTTVEYEFDSGFIVKSITARKVYDTELGVDMDASNYALLENTQSENNQQFTQEFQLISPDDGDFRYVLGAYYLDNRSTSRQQLIAPSGYVVPTFQAAPAPAYIAVSAGEAGTLNATLDTESVAAFTHMTYDFNSAFSGFLGLRYSEVEKELGFVQDGLDGSYLDGTFTPLPGEVFLNGFADIPKAVQKLKDSFVSWTFGGTLDLEMLIDIPANIYGTVSKGYKEGGYSVRFQTIGSIGGNINNPVLDFDREEVTSYEVGFKGSLLDDRMRVNVALFYLDYKDIQANVIDNVGASRITNGPTATSQGVEMELLFRASEYVTLDASVGYVDATYGDFEACDNSDDCSDNKLPGAATWTVNAGISLDMPLSDTWDLIAGLDYAYRDSMFTTARNLEELKLDGSHLVNAQFGVLSDELGIEVMIWAKNLMDNDYFVRLQDQGTSELSISGEVMGPPRTYGVSLTYQF